MLIELEAISGGEEIRFENGENLASPFVFTRPTHLPLAKRNTFSPTLPSTPEFMLHREVSFSRSLPDKTHPAIISENGLYSPASKRLSCIISTNKIHHSVNVDEVDDSSCCWWWMNFRWQKMRRKSRRDVTVKCDVISSGSRKSRASVLRRKTAASQPMSIFGKENKREWGEEHCKDVVYAVMLKRIRRAPSPGNEISNGLLWETQKVRHIKGATLPHLVGQLCQFFVDDWGERNFLTVFLATYRSFATPAEVLDLIIKEGENFKQECIEKRIPTLSSIVRVLKTWLERYFKEDFYDPPHHSLLKRLQHLAEEYQTDENQICQPSTPSDSDCDFVTFVKSKLQSAEVKGSQEDACENLFTTSHFVDMLDETEDICVEEESLNMDAAKTFLSRLSSLQIAEQLTVMDANLFLRIVPYHCLNAVRSFKDKPATVKATIDQFNKVVFCVLGTCLCPGLKTSQRANIICKWIKVAQPDSLLEKCTRELRFRDFHLILNAFQKLQECRELKNFSSLRAVASGLQTHAIHRLKRTWQQVPHANCSLLEELSEINIKDSIKKVGTAKVNTEKSSISRVRKDASTRRQQTIHSGIMHGTVPYLGSFLSDLTYLDTAKPDFIEKGLINFDKRRKEFELLAQLQLWQASCRSYQHLDTDSGFFDWFNSVTLPTDDQAIQLSEEIEAPNSIPLSPAATPSSPAASEMFSGNNGSLNSSGNSSTSFPANHVSNLSSGLSETTKSDSESTTVKLNGHATIETSCTEGRTINVQVIKKVTDDNDNTESKEPKEMNLCSNDRSPAFMKKAFGLFDLENEDLHNFKLMQILPDDKELIIPETGNVFYAMNSATKEYNFVLVEEGAEFPREKRVNRTQTLPRSNKQKHRLRKAAASTSTPLSSSSPMKSLYRHLGMTSGFHTPSRDVQRQDEASDDKSDAESVQSTPELKHRKKSADDSLSSVTRFSESSSDESDNSLRQKVWKTLTRVKGHRRNYSDSGGIWRAHSDHATSQPNVKNLIAAITDNVINPVSNQVDLSSSESSISDIRWPSTSSDGDLEAASSSTWPRKHAFSVSNESKHHNQVVKKHHSHGGSHDPRKGSALKVTRSKPSPQSPSKNIRKTDSRSKFYIEINDKSEETRQSHNTSDSMKPIDEAEDLSTDLSLRKSISRSASEPCKLELGENEVFQDSAVLPTIIIQSPSPKKLSGQGDRQACSPSPKVRLRLSSETRTTVL